MARNQTTGGQTTGRITIHPILGLIIAIAILYFAREIFIPFALALLISFLLSPTVRRFESWRLPRPAASVLTVALALCIIGGMGYFVANQFAGTLTYLPEYAANIHRRILRVEGRSSRVTRALTSLQQLGHETEQPPPTAARRRAIEKNAARRRETPNDAAPVPVEIVDSSGIFRIVRDYGGNLIRLVGLAGLAVAFTIFMLIDRENMRNRLLRLMGEQRIQATTQAMDDAGRRVSRYLLLQLLVNSMFGAVTGIGLYFIGVPNWLLWGVMGLFLRFIPYAGPLIAASLPLVVALGTSQGWRMPVLVIVLYLATELVTGNFVEPFIYGVHTGLSAVAILASALFWTLIWGPIGLIVATPLTVCLTVFARYSTQFEFLNVILGDEPVLSPDIVLYQRLLALDQNDAWALVQGLVAEKSLLAVFDEVIFPAFAMAERDRSSGQLDLRHEEFVVQSIHEIITELIDADATSAIDARRQNRVVCLAGAGESDEIASAVMAHFAGQEGYSAIPFPAGDSFEDSLAALELQARDIVIVSCLPPFAASHARATAKRIRKAAPQAMLIVGLWTASPAGQEQIERLKKTFSAAVVTSIGEALEQIRSLNAPAAIPDAARESSPVPVTVNG